MLERLFRTLIDTLGDVRRANTWQVATGIVVLGIAAAIFRGTAPTILGAFVRIWGLFVVGVGVAMIGTGILESRMKRLDDDRRDQRALSRYRRAALDTSDP